MSVIWRSLYSVTTTDRAQPGEREVIWSILSAYDVPGCKWTVGGKGKWYPCWTGSPHSLSPAQSRCCGAVTTGRSWGPDFQPQLAGLFTTKDVGLNLTSTISCSVNLGNTHSLADRCLLLMEKTVLTSQGSGQVPWGKVCGDAGSGMPHSVAPLRLLLWMVFHLGNCLTSTTPQPHCLSPKMVITKSNELS